jgi:hypothetical protein
MALPVRDKLELAELLLEMGQIPVVTQESQTGKYFTFDCGTSDQFLF